MFPDESRVIEVSVSWSQSAGMNGINFARVSFLIILTLDLVATRWSFFSTENRLDYFQIQTLLTKLQVEQALLALDLVPEGVIGPHDIEELVHWHVEVGVQDQDSRAWHFIFCFKFFLLMNIWSVGPYFILWIEGGDREIFRKNEFTYGPCRWSTKKYSTR